MIAPCTARCATVAADGEVVAEVGVAGVGGRADGAGEAPGVAAVEQVGHAAAVALGAVGAGRTDQEAPGVAGQRHGLTEIAR